MIRNMSEQDLGEQSLGTKLVFSLHGRIHSSFAASSNASSRAWMSSISIAFLGDSVRCPRRAHASRPAPWGQLTFNKVETAAPDGQLNSTAGLTFIYKESNWDLISIDDVNRIDDIVKSQRVYRCYPSCCFLRISQPHSI